MPYKPQPGLRLHRRLLGETLAGIEDALVRVRKLRGLARNEASRAYITDLEVVLLQGQINLYRMMDIINNAEGGEEETGTD